VRSIDHLFANIPVRDREAAGEWYERLFGRPPDLLPNAREAAWQLTDTGWIVIEADPPRAGTALHTLLVADLDALLAEIAQRGVPVGPVETIGPGVRQAIVADPDGNRLKVGQVPA
jgi:predicted enzyme related to lactoylglutathione lyase